LRTSAIEDVLSVARRALEELTQASATAAPGSSMFTRREHEVVGLLARGATNRQIAEALVVAERTAEMHVSNILAKLGLTGRAQVAAWAAEQRDGVALEASPAGAYRGTRG
jgi:non-specific serine/threonine protein kinase